MKKIKLAFLAFFLPISLHLSFAQSPVSINGKLKLVGTQLSSECGNPVQLRGISSHGPQWFGSCVFKNTAVATLGKDWGSDIVRLAMYVESEGYLSNPVYWKEWIDAAIERIGNNGMYCIIDWHILSDGDPFKNITASKEFWAYMSAKHADKKHVMYEICNEPNGVDWPRIKAYADTIIPIIRANDPDKIIIVGTPQWSGSPISVVGNELSGANAYNVMYAFHFYAASHAWMIPNLKLAIGSIPIFSSEWGTSSSTGDGTINTRVTDQFMDVFNGNNPSGNIISWCNWSFSDADETSAALLPGSCGAATWNNTTPSGTKLKALINTPDRFAPCDGSPFILTQPDNKKAKLDSSVTLKIKAVGIDIKYQWKHSLDSSSWTNVSNADTSFLEIKNMTEKDTGFYKVIVSNLIDTIESNVARLRIFYNGPFTGKHLPIPGRIEAEFYDEGNAGFTYLDKTVGNSGGAFRNDNVDIETTKDTSGMYNIGWVSAGEFLTYSVDVIESGKYDFEFRVASGVATIGEISVSMSDSIIISPLQITPSGDWQVWKSVFVKEVSLPKGLNKMKLNFLTNDFNINYINIQKHDPLGLEDISVFPQPANESLKISSSSIDFTGKSIEIIDMLGAKIQETISNGKTVELDVKNLKKGIYLLKIQTNNSFKILKWNKN
jgi:aryl-phospho-beta-D-glucosidase BglC (GH1 family)